MLVYIIIIMSYNNIIGYYFKVTTGKQISDLEMRFGEQSLELQTLLLFAGLENLLDLNRNKGL